MYTFDLLKAEMLIAHAKVSTELKSSYGGACNSAINASAVKSLEEAQRLILNAKLEQQS